ncbi:MAG: hypothetical protein AAF921_02630 [Cyanobacteria bacterium P01_D01_bin.44]
MASIRLSEDVHQIAQHISQTRGLGSTRVAIEAVVRTCWQHYLSGNCTVVTTTPQGARPLTIESNIDAATALDSVL